MQLAGIDFSCSPSRRKPIVVASGRLAADTLRLDTITALPTLAAFEGWLRTPGPWLAAFDFPFGLPRAFVAVNGLGASAAEVVANVHRRWPTRLAWRAFIDAWGNAQPTGARLLHRETDVASPVHSTSPLQTRYVPVGFMYYEGFSRLVAAGVELPCLCAGDPTRVAIEGYPRRLAHALVERSSYKNSELPDRAAAREAMVSGLEAADASAGIALAIDAASRRSVIEDASGDRLDAVLCLVQAARASGLSRYGMPDDVHPVEGWIVGG